MKTLQTKMQNNWLFSLTMYIYGSAKRLDERKAKTTSKDLQNFNSAHRRWEAESMLETTCDVWREKFPLGLIFFGSPSCEAIYKATIFSDEQLILRIEASKYVESLRLNRKLFSFLTSSNSILTCRS